MFGNLLHKDLEEFISDWNVHPIRKSHTVDTPHGRPIDIYDMPELYGMSASICFIGTVYNIILFLLGSSDQLQTIDCSLWAKSMLTESKPAPLLCPNFFRTAARRILQNNLHLNEGDITHNNCQNIYVKLVHHIQLLVADGMF